MSAAVAELAGYPDVLHLQRTTAFGSYDDGFVLALERRTDHLGAPAPKHLSRQRIWRLRAKSIVVATGPTNDRWCSPTTTGPASCSPVPPAPTCNRYGVLPGRDAVVFTTNDSAYDAAVDLHRAGVRIQAVVDARPEVPARHAELEQPESVLTRAGSSAPGVSIGSPTPWSPFLGGEVGDIEAMACDLLLVSGGWNPAVHLFSQSRGRLRYDEQLGAFLPGGAARRAGRCRIRRRRVHPRRVPGRRPARPRARR